MKKTLFLTLLVVAGALAGVATYISKRLMNNDLVHEFCTLPADAPAADLHVFWQTAAHQGADYSDCVKAFIARKKERAIHAVQKEWHLSASEYTSLLQRKNAFIDRMKAEPNEGYRIEIASDFGASAQSIEAMISTITRENNINNIDLEVIHADVSSPVIYYCDTDTHGLPTYLLELPEDFEKQNADFQRGNLEHELMHATCGHNIETHDVAHHLAVRDKIDREAVMESPSFQKLSRACEYEADLLPSLKRPTIAKNLLSALDGVKLIDEAHPPTRKRKKMVQRIARFGELADPSLKVL